MVFFSNGSELIFLLNIIDLPPIFKQSSIMSNAVKGKVDVVFGAATIGKAGEFFQNIVVH